MTNLEHRALLGDREAQDECTRQAPTIVRCGECKYNKNCILITEGDFVATDFCSAGERKGGAKQ